MTSSNRTVPCTGEGNLELIRNPRISLPNPGESPSVSNSGLECCPIVRDGFVVKLGYRSGEGFADVNLDEDIREFRAPKKSASGEDSSVARRGFGW
jgi:hypothetical protein